VFPCRDAQDRGHRQALEGLARAGFLTPAAGRSGVPAWENGVYEIHADTYRALERAQEQDRGLER